MCQKLTFIGWEGAPTRAEGRGAAGGGEPLRLRPQVAR
jgi:hypothetical protein